MLWKLFFPSVESVDVETARQQLSQNPDLQVLDVRQPGEYAAGHIAGARLIPLPELGSRAKELDVERPVLVYCAIGGRSRVAAQMLAAKDFDRVLNLKGGFKAWNGPGTWSAVGDLEQGLEHFPDLNSLEAVLGTAYAMEGAMQRYYVQRASDATNVAVGDLLGALADIETGHKAVVAATYRKLLGKDSPTDLPPVPEGGLSVEEYLRRLGVRLDQPQEVVDFAMTVEAQALDLYTRAAERAKGQSRAFLEHMAGEERKHLLQLAALMDTLTGA